jgi:hypothetical protein
MSLIPSSSQLPALFSVLKLFLIPVGGGIPAGVLLARAGGLAWPVTTLLYLLSDLILVLAFEPCLRLLALVGKRITLLARRSPPSSKRPPAARNASAAPGQAPSRW